MISITFAGKIVMAMHIVTIEMTGMTEDSGKFLISLSNGLILSEDFNSPEEKLEIAKRLAFDQKSGN